MILGIYNMQLSHHIHGALAKELPWVSKSVDAQDP